MPFFCYIINEKLAWMLNSIVLSADMETLYLIDNGRTIEFPLNEQGVLIGMLNGQLTAASAIKVPTPVKGDDDFIDEDGIKGEDEDDPADRLDRVEAERRPKAILPLRRPTLFPTQLKLSLENSQWNFSFNPDKGYFFAIGATDIFFDRPDTIKSHIHIFALRKGVMRLTRKERAINITFLEGGK